MYNSLHYPNFTPAELEVLMNGERARQQRLKTNQNWEIFNRYHEDFHEHHRRELIQNYSIIVDDFGNYTDITDHSFLALLHHTLEQIAEALTDQAQGAAKYGVSDDGLDYLHATSDQLTWVYEMLANDDRHEAKKTLIAVLNQNINEYFDNGSDGFHYGYADHGTDISDLMKANHQEPNEGN